MLIENGEIKPESTLRKTFNKYLHPDVIDKESKELYELIGNDSITDVFQFSTDIARDAIQKVKPSNLTELASINSVMRLMSDSGEQPIDTFLRFKNNIDEWYHEMQEYGLNDEEIKIMEEHLLKLNGVADTQESVMVMAQDKRIAGFSIQESNVLRKAIAKPNKNKVEKLRNKFINNGLELGNRKELLTYVWDVQIARQLEYSFSTLHVVAYTLMALQEANLNLYYNPIYWQTACLTVNGGALDMDENNSNKQSTKYGKIASAIADMQRRGVTIALPNINKANFEFTPDVENNAILFGLKGISGIGDDIAHTIIEHRPYKSFDDFVTRMVDTKLIKNSQVIQLIKAGCFDEFDDRLEIMKQYVQRTYQPRKSLTLASFNTVINLGIVPEDLSLYIRFYRYRQYIQKNVVGRTSERKTKNRLFQLDEISTEFLYEHFFEDCIVDYDEKTSLPIVAEWLFDSQYDKKMEKVKKWLAKESTLKLVNDKLFQKEWEKVAGDANISEWEMSSLSYYYSGHELEHLNKEKYDVTDYSDIPEEPIPVKKYEWKGKIRYEYRTYRIAGTVLDKDKNRYTVTILTTDGVVVVKLYPSKYSYYDRQLSIKESDGKKRVVEASWFKRGNLIMFSGFRRGNQFIPRIYRSSIHQHDIIKINSIDKEGNLSLQTERAYVE